MTYEEAVERLKKRICQEGVHREDKTYHFCTDGCMYGEEECEIAIAIKALEKQILKKPIDITVSRLDSHMISCRCPKCNARQSYGSIDWHKWFNKRCFECGQALDWSDEE